MRILNIDFPGRLHVPDLEREAINQMPKVGWWELKLYRYANTDLYQWYGKKGWSVFEDPCDGPFQMTPEEGSVEDLIWAAKRLSTLWATNGQKVDSDEFYAAVNKVYETTVAYSLPEVPEALRSAALVAAKQLIEDSYKFTTETIPEGTLRRHQKHDCDLQLTAVNFPRIFEAFESISQDSGAGGGHPCYYVPPRFATMIQLRQWEKLLSDLTKKQIGDFLLGEEFEKQVWIEAHAEREALKALDCFLNDFFDDWNSNEA